MGGGGGGGGLKMSVKIYYLSTDFSNECVIFKDNIYNLISMAKTQG